MFAAKAQRSAWEMRSGTYFFVMLAINWRATVGKPEFAAQRPSPDWGKRSAPFGQPPAPCMKTPASCHDRRMRMGPQFFLVKRSSISPTRLSKVIAFLTTRLTVGSALHLSNMTLTFLPTPLTSTMLSPARSFEPSGADLFQASASPPVMLMMGSNRRSVMKSTSSPSGCGAPPPASLSRVTMYWPNSRTGGASMTGLRPSPLPSPVTATASARWSTSAVDVSCLSASPLAVQHFAPMATFLAPARCRSGRPGMEL
mmetsp:Transcript_115601/g.331924  ORF Transcript_115601/g.331924 Transcript_115601/m.331924 type:complete len:256 (-) Transcript_115601:37-804(-)